MSHLILLKVTFVLVFNVFVFDFFEVSKNGLLFYNIIIILVLDDPASMQHDQCNVVLIVSAVLVCYLSVQIQNYYLKWLSEELLDW